MSDFNIDGVEKTITLADKVYDGTTNTQQDLIDDVQAAIDAGGAFGPGAATVCADFANKIVITSTTTGTGNGSDVQVLGGGLVDSIFEQ
ncbi:hypothetical protein KHA80_13060 [Anaerobacillus sp. HL2]|nr:hypothetical protein KHA80_13060 [Anaerobacillus sp. HL2]